MFKSVRVITCATTHAMETVQYFADTFDLEITKSLTAADRGFNDAIVDIGGIPLEFVEPMDENEKPVNNFVKKRGPGMYLLEREVESLEEAVEKLRKKSVRPMDDGPESRRERGG